MPLGPQVPPNLFAIALGIAGLALAWDTAAALLGTARLVPDVLDLLDAAI
jgi:tellurite resistance protein TehA-like permease